MRSYLPAEHGTPVQLNSIKKVTLLLYSTLYDWFTTLQAPDSNPINFPESLTFGLALQASAARVVLSGQSWAPGAKAANWVAAAFGSGKAARGSAVYCVFFFFPVVVSNISYFHPCLGRWSNLTRIFFQGGWNHLLVFFCWGRVGRRSCAHAAIIFYTIMSGDTQFQSGHLVRCAILIVYIVNWLRYSYYIAELYFASIYHRWLWLTWASGFDPFCFV